MPPRLILGPHGAALANALAYPPRIEPTWRDKPRNQAANVTNSQFQGPALGPKTDSE